MPVPVFESIVDALSGSSWSYAIVFVIAALDAFFPIVPSEATAIVGGVIASRGELNVGVLVLAAAVGAFVGDNISFGIGHFFGKRTVARFFSGEKAQGRLAWAEHALEERKYLIVVARFIPGGRTAITFTAGYLQDFPWRVFLMYDGIACAIWGSYTVLLGYFGGTQFEEQPWKGLVLAFGIAFGVTLLIEAARWLRHRSAAV
jgi:membrane protein DedA with SNARE-associated domain